MEFKYTVEYMLGGLWRMRFACNNEDEMREVLKVLNKAETEKDSSVSISVEVVENVEDDF